MQWTTSKDNKLLSMHRLSPTPFSSDEGAESGDDSEEDVITSYLPENPSHPTAAVNRDPLPNPHPHPHLHHRHPQQLPLHQCHQSPHRPLCGGMGVLPAHGHGHGPPARRLVRMAEIPTMDSMTAESLGMGPIVGVQNPESFVASIPTISITPHSPITQKPFTTLDESLRQLQVLQEKIQKMRDAPLTVKGGRGSLPRLSSSCPSLNVEGEEMEDEDPSSWSEEFLLDARKIHGSIADAHRRRSWAGLSDEEKKRARQRSVSLSSLDSDTEEPFYDAEDSGNTHGSENIDGSKKHRSLSGSSSPAAYAARTGGSSTHSLNEEHFEAKATKSSCSEKPRLLAPRLTLQKSISTPSILAGVQNQQHQQLQQVPQLNYHADEHSTSKPRKRGSVFFRRKKEKSKKTSHQFMSVCYSNSATCDVCSKPMTNKPALRCETCLVCVHEHTCKDQISDCSKLKTAKMLHKGGVGGSAGNLHTTAKSASLGSTPGSLGGPFTSSSRSQPPMATRSKSSVAISSSPTRPSGLVPSKVTSEEKDEVQQDAMEANSALDDNSASTESLIDDTTDGTDSMLHSIDSDPDLRLLEKEPENWVDTVEKELVNRLTEKQKKRQAAIYELIITEKHHCRMLKILKQLFAEGMLRELGLKETLVRSIFPRLDELITIHFSFLWRLRELQRTSKFISNIGDLLHHQFVGDNAQCFKDSYGEFCSKHKDALANYKDLLKTDRRFQAFISKRANHHLMSKKGMPEGILFVTHRMTKYPLIIEAIIKYSGDKPVEIEKLRNALDCVKEILVYINDKVAEEESSKRLLEIYNKIDAKSFTTYKDQKFKKSDFFTNERKLKFEGQALFATPQSKGKQIPLMVILFTDLVFFLQENNQKYYFFSPDSNKPGVIPLMEVFERPVAQDSKSIYLVSGNQTKPIELECVHPKDRNLWIESIRVNREIACAEATHRNSKLKEANSTKLHELIVRMQQQDRELCRICEDRMKTVNDFYAELGCENIIEPVNYKALLDENNLDPESAKELQITSLNEALRLVSGACGWGTNLARSVSSVGERQSDAYVSPSLPKRAETFGGFDNPNKDNSLQPCKQTGAKKKKDSKTSLISESGTDVADCLSNRRPSGSTVPVRASQDNVSVVSAISTDSASAMNVQQQQVFATNLIQCLNTALVLSHHHLTQYEMLRAKVATGSIIDTRFSHSQKLEELRNIQEDISHERAQWNRERENQEKWISDKKVEIKQQQENLRLQQEDVNQQREDLYRKLEGLRNQGIVIVLNPTLTVLPSALPPHQPPIDFGSSSLSGDAAASQSSVHTSPASTAGSRPRPDVKHRNSTHPLHPHKIAAPPRQKLPMKLAKCGAGSSSSSSTGSMSSSLSSSMSGSFGGTLSPSQDKEQIQPQLPQTKTHASSPSGPQQILPMKLSEGTSEPKATRYNGGGGGGYQRLSSPPAGGSESQSGFVHQRTGSSPASLQNGSPVSATSPVTASTTSSFSSSTRRDEGPSGGGRASRTHTYPKLPSKPATSERATSSDMSRLTESADPRPGQRIKDPDTDQDIIFF